MRKIYLDNAAATPLDREVFKKMKPYFFDIYGNPSSFHGAGKKAKDAIFSARKKVAKILGANLNEIIFTNGGTESNNLAILGAARANKKFGNHIITSKIEHSSVLETCHHLAHEGFEISYLNVDRNGIIKIDELKKALKKETILVSIMYANNEIGTIQPIVKISNIIRNFRNSKFKTLNSKQIQNSKFQISKKRFKNLGLGISDLRFDERTILPFFHTDACQATGALDINVQNLGVDLMTLNGGKIYGPKTSGILYKKENVKIEPLLYGGEQEMGFRPGTENVANIVGFASALELAEKLRKKESKRLTQLRNYLIKRVLKEIPKSRLNGHPEKRLPNNAHFTFLDIEGEAMLLYLDNYGIYCSTGSACASLSLESSHVILALGIPFEAAHGSLRVSMGRFTTKKDIDYFIKVLKRGIEYLRKISPLKLNPKYFR